MVNKIKWYENINKKYYEIEKIFLYLNITLPSLL